MVICEWLFAKRSVLGVITFLVLFTIFPHFRHILCINDSQLRITFCVAKCDSCTSRFFKSSPNCVVNIIFYYDA